MDYSTLGRSGLRVSRLCLGTMTFGKEWGFGTDEQSSVGMLDLFLERGGNFVDTANMYNAGHSEAILGSYFYDRASLRDRIVLATKFSANLHPGDANGGGASRKAIVAACEQSLRRLRTDYIDLYWMHWWDRFTPIEETMRALDDLVRDGKIRYAGFSDAPAWKVAQAQTLSLLRGWSPLIALQIEYSLLERTVEAEYVGMAIELGLGITPWSPLRAGLLSGKYSSTSKVESARAGLNEKLDERALRVIDAVNAIAAETGTTPARVALAWLAGRPGVDSIIIGARTIDQLTDNLGAIDVALDDAQAKTLDEVSAPPLAFPWSFLPRSWEATYGGLTIDGTSFGESYLPDKGKAAF